MFFFCFCFFERTTNHVIDHLHGLVRVKCLFALASDNAALHLPAWGESQSPLPNPR